MKIKRNSGKKQLHKWAKLGVAFASVAVLGGVAAPVNGQLLNTSSVAYAQEKTTKVIVNISKFSSNFETNIQSTNVEYIPTGVSKTYIAPVFEGYELEAARISYLDTMTITHSRDGVLTLPDGFSDSIIGVTFSYFEVEKPVESQPTTSSSSTSQSSASKPSETSTSSTQPSATKPT
ncbi:TPA: hypothetical protein ACGO7Y_002331, partial [Streptococcus suis]